MASGTVSIAADNTSVLSGQKVTFLITVTNSSTTTAITVQSVIPVVTPVNGWFNLEPPSTPIGGSVIAASGTAYFQAYGMFGQNQNQDFNPPVPAYQQFTVICTVNFSDGTSLTSGSILVSASPITTPPTAMPGSGQARFESNLESGISLLVLM